MENPFKNVITWNRSAIRRAEGRARRAANDADRKAANDDIARYQGNIEFLEGKAR